MRRVNKLSDEDRLNAIGAAADSGLSGMGGDCGAAAIAINRVLFNNKASYVAAVNWLIWEKTKKIIGHVGVEHNGVIWDWEGTFDDEEAREQFLSWGMLEVGDYPELLTNETEAMDAKIIPVTEQDIINSFGQNKLYEAELRKHLPQPKIKTTVSSSFENYAEGLWIHYSKLPQLTINPKQFHQDPAGLYLFPEKFKTEGNWHRFPYRIVCRLKPGLRVLDIPRLTREQILGLLDAFGFQDMKSDEYLVPGKSERDQGVQDRFWDIIRQRFLGEPGRFNKAWRRQGYDAIFDDQGIIHPSETQLIVLNPRFVEIVRVEEQKATGFSEVNKVLDLMASRYGSLGEVKIRRPTQQKDWGEKQLRGSIEIRNGADYAEFTVSPWFVSPKDENTPETISVRLRSDSKGLKSKWSWGVDLKFRNFDAELHRLTDPKEDVAKAMKEIFGEGAVGAVLPVVTPMGPDFADSSDAYIGPPFGGLGINTHPMLDDPEMWRRGATLPAQQFMKDLIPLLSAFVGAPVVAENEGELNIEIDGKGVASGQIHSADGLGFWFGNQEAEINMDNFPHEVVAILEHIEIEPKFRREGVGTALVGAFEKSAEKNGAEAVFLNASPFGSEMGGGRLTIGQIVSFYKSLGYKTWQDEGNSQVMFRELKKEQVQADHISDANNGIRRLIEILQEYGLTEGELIHCLTEGAYPPPTKEESNHFTNAEQILNTYIIQADSFIRCAKVHLKPLNLNQKIMKYVNRLKDNKASKEDIYEILSKNIIWILSEPISYYSLENILSKKIVVDYKAFAQDASRLLKNAMKLSGPVYDNKEKLKFESYTDSKGYYSVTVYDDHHNVIAILETIPLMVEPGPDDDPNHLVESPTELKVWDVFVRPNWTRQGIATEMYRMAERETGKKLVGGDFQTPQGKEFRKAIGDFTREDTSGFYPEGWHDDKKKDPARLAPDPWINQVPLAIRSAAITELYCDQDGCLSDFDQMFFDHAGKRTDEVESQELWKTIDRIQGFWTDMDWMPDGPELWAFIKSYNPKILSAPSMSPDCIPGKKDWLARHVGEVPAIFESQKEKYAGPGKVLIDDRLSNIEKWRAAGGIGIHHASAADTIRQLKEILGTAEAGARGDWEAEGFRFEIKLNSEKTYLTIRAISPGGEEAGIYDFEIKWKEPGVILIVDSRTKEKYQRKGLATEAYRTAEELLKGKIKPLNYEQSKDAEKLWNNPNRGFGSGRTESALEAQARRAEAKAIIPEDSDLMHFYNLADREAWVEEVFHESKREWAEMSEEDRLARIPEIKSHTGWKDLPSDPAEEGWEEIERGWLMMRERDAMEDAPTSQTFFENAKIVKNPTLVRFTNYPGEALHGGTFEGHEPGNLGLTVPYGRPGKGDLAFAFNLKELKNSSAWKAARNKYGNYIFKFKVPYAVEADHISDGERQTVFDVNTVTDLQEIDSDDFKVIKKIPF